MYLSNPEANASQQRTLMILFVVVIGVMMVGQIMRPPQPPAAGPEAVGEAGEPEPGALPGAPAADPTSDDAAVDLEAAAERGAGNAAGPADEAAAPAVAVEPPRRIVTPGAEAEFWITNAGGRVAAVNVLAPEQYTTTDDNQEILPHLPTCDGLADGSRDCAANTEALRTTYLPLGLRLPGLSEYNERTSVWSIDEEASACTTDGLNQRCTSLVMAWTSRDGQLTVRRTFRAHDRGPYGLITDLEITNNSSSDRVIADVQLATYGAWNEKKGGMFNQADSVVEGGCLDGGRLRSRPGRKLAEERRWDGGILFAGVNERYFMTAIAARGPNGEALESPYCVMRQPAGTVEQIIEAYVGSGQLIVPANGTQSLSWTFFAGPKRFEYLDAYPHRFRKSVKYGAVAFLAVPIRAVLVFFHGLVGNWGLAILLLTLLIKLLLWPVTQKSYESMEAMKKLQPRIAKLKEKYGNDQQRLAQEQMNLFREEGVSPFGGCLPMLLQMPVYFALYRTIWGSAELYNAPFFWWITDLSRPDQYFVLPVLMSLVMLVQVRLTPTPQDNPQMKMMQWLMPIMFIPLMLFLPSGLVLYIFLNMLLSIGQQLMIRKRLAAAA